MRVTERLASLFIEENLRDREVLAEGTNQFLEAQLDDARRRLIENEKGSRNTGASHVGRAARPSSTPTCRDCTTSRCRSRRSSNR